eukprot:3987591-Amphidinium_carterae.1
MSCKIEAILDEERLEFVYKDTALVELVDAIDTYNLLNTQLRMEFAEKPFFHFTIKNHALAHVALQAAVLSPRFSLWGPYLPAQKPKKYTYHNAKNWDLGQTTQQKEMGTLPTQRLEEALVHKKLTFLWGPKLSTQKMGSH